MELPRLLGPRVWSTPARGRSSFAERVTARAARRGRLVVLAVAVARQAGRAIAARRGLVRCVAATAGRVGSDAVESRERRLRVTALAARWRGWTVGPMRAMTGRAGERSAVRRLGLRRM